MAWRSALLADGRDAGDFVSGRVGSLAVRVVSPDASLAAVLLVRFLGVVGRFCVVVSVVAGSVLVRWGDLLVCRGSEVSLSSSLSVTAVVAFSVSAVTLSGSVVSSGSLVGGVSSFVVVSASAAAVGCSSGASVPVESAVSVVASTRTGIIVDSWARMVSVIAGTCTPVSVVVRC